MSKYNKVTDELFTGHIIHPETRLPEQSHKQPASYVAQQSNSTKIMSAIVVVCVALTAKFGIDTYHNKQVRPAIQPPQTIITNIEQFDCGSLDHERALVPDEYTIIDNNKVIEPIYFQASVNTPNLLTFEDVDNKKPMALHKYYVMLADNNKIHLNKSTDGAPLSALLKIEINKIHTCLDLGAELHILPPQRLNPIASTDTPSTEEQQKPEAEATANQIE